jgi:ribosomal protein S4E
VTQGAVKVDGKVVTDINFQFQGRMHQIIEVGKNRIAQVAKEP